MAVRIASTMYGSATDTTKELIFMSIKKSENVRIKNIRLK
jgi:pectate lyase